MARLDSDLSPAELLDIKSIVQFGTRSPEMYQVKFYEVVYGKIVKVRIRGLSNYEYDEISVKMFADIKDPATIKYVFDPKNEKQKEKGESGIEKKRKSLLEEDLPDNVNPSAILRAYQIRNALIVFKAMEDFYTGLTLSKVKQLEGLSEIAHRVNEKSGRTPEIAEKIKFFREEFRKRVSTLSDEEGT